MTFHNPTLARCVTTADMMCARDRRAAAQQHPAPDRRKPHRKKA